MTCIRSGIVAVKFAAPTPSVFPRRKNLLAPLVSTGLGVDWATAGELMDGTDLIEADDTDLLSDAAVARLRAHPRFREAVEAHAAGALAEYESQDNHERWLLKDLGRASLWLGAMILDTIPGGLTVSALAAAAAERQVCSRGRVLAFVHYALDTGRLTLSPGSEPWVRRRLVLTPAFLEPSRRRMSLQFRTVALLAPEVAAAPAEARVRQRGAAIQRRGRNAADRASGAQPKSRWTPAPDLHRPRWWHADAAAPDAAPAQGSRAPADCRPAPVRRCPAATAFRAPT